MSNFEIHGGLGPGPKAPSLPTRMAITSQTSDLQINMTSHFQLLTKLLKQ